MARPISERVKDWRWWLEQALHVAIGSVAASVLWISQPILAGVFSALWVAGLREYEQRPVQSWSDLAVDVACTVVGGIAMGLIVWGVTR